MSKISWKLFLIVLVSSFILCSNVSASNCVKDAKAAQKEEVKEAAEAGEVAKEEVAKEEVAKEEAEEVEAEEVEE